MINPLFPANFFSLTKLPDPDKAVELLLNAKLHSDQEFSWCGEDDGRNIKVERLEAETVLPIAGPSISAFLQELGCLPCRISIHDVWKCTYSFGGYQETHQHKPSLISAVIFLDNYEEGASVFSFLNPEVRIIPDDLLKLLPNVTETVNLTPMKGDILIFPSHAYHNVTKHQIEKPRRTVALNINLHKEEDITK